MTSSSSTRRLTRRSPTLGHSARPLCHQTTIITNSPIHNNNSNNTLHHRSSSRNFHPSCILNSRQPLPLGLPPPARSLGGSTSARCLCLRRSTCPLLDHPHSPFRCMRATPWPLQWPALAPKLRTDGWVHRGPPDDQSFCGQHGGPNCMFV